MKILTIVGARPQFVKAGLVCMALAEKQEVSNFLVHTGQHYDRNMSEVFFDELSLPRPDVWLGVGSGSHGDQTGKMLSLLDGILLEQNPDWVVVYGDTNSTIAGALSAAKLHFPVAHVESGLRSFNRKMPEEVNRVVVDHVAELLFAPTTAAVENLEREGIELGRVHLTGDVMYDAALHFGEEARRRSDILARLGLQSGGYVLATVHRAGNTDEPGRLASIVGGLLAVSRELPVVVPLHPRTRQALQSLGLLGSLESGLRLLAPVGYLDMLRLEMDARLVVTDSGGVQKEAFFFKVPCATLREETEWVELVELGWNRLVPPDSVGAVSAGIMAALDCSGIDAEPYGRGRAAEHISGLLCGESK